MKLQPFKSIFSTTVALLLQLVSSHAYAGSKAPENLAPPESNISAEFPYESKFLRVDGINIHYVEEGEGEPIILVHGVPTSSYLYRNIISRLSKNNRVIALDIAGFGKSDMPKTGLSYSSFYQYFDGFIKKMQLKNITFVVQDAGSLLGLDFAAKNPSLIKGLAMMEAAVPPRVPVKSETDLRPFQIMMRDPEKGEKYVIEENGFIEELMPVSILRELKKEELDAYRQPFISKSRRAVILAWPRLIPVNKKPEDSYNAVKGYSNWLKTTKKPILLMKFSPGALIRAPQIEWLESNVNNLTSTWIGKGVHYVQESHPKAISNTIIQWMKKGGL